MSRPLPAHGTAARYAGTRLRAGCRCQRCLQGHSRACKLRRVAHDRGEVLRPDKAPVVAHILALQAAGMSLSQIGRAAGKAQSTVCRVLSGPSKAVNRDTARAILAVRPVLSDPVGMVDSLGSVRRVRALYALGHGRRALASTCGLHTDTISGLAAGRWERVTEQTAAHIRRAYDELSMRVGTVRRNRSMAYQLGWAPPLAWDDGDIDDPAGTPAVCGGEDEALDYQAIDQALARGGVTLTASEQTAGVVEGRLRGLSFLDLSERLDMAEADVRRIWDTTLNRARRGHPMPEKLPCWHETYQTAA